MKQLLLLQIEYWLIQARFYVAKTIHESDGRYDSLFDEASNRVRHLMSEYEKLLNEEVL